MKDLQYRYSEGNLLEFPQKYSLTEFEGKEFLIDYKNQRNTILDNIKEKNLEIDLGINIRNQKINFIELEEIGQFNTKNLLGCFLQQLRKEKIDKKLEKIFFVLIKKFEVKKNLFSIYDSNCKEVSKTYNNLTNYLLLSVICLHYYEHNKNLKFLNTVLKLNDTTTSQFNNLTDSYDFSLLHYSISKELENINKLVMKKEIELE